MNYRILPLALAVALFSACNKTTSETTTETAAAETQTELKASDLVHNPNTANAQEIKANGPLPKMEFATSEHDFGLITPGETVTHTFEFKNTGEAPLIIENASASCGCTVPEYPKEPIAPGTSGKIKVSFDSKGKFGMQNKQVTISANTIPNITTLTIKGNIPGGPETANGPVKQ